MALWVIDLEQEIRDEQQEMETEKMPEESVWVWQRLFLLGLLDTAKSCVSQDSSC